ncbi:MAG: SH3 domain-containing protein [Proteobacteria bacterium]|nr:SH3 domain-containing protein [Pseudomonadota bacterium]
MLLIPVPLRPDRHGHADAPVARFSQHGLPSLSPVAAPRAGAALLSLPEEIAGEVPAPDMPEVASIASSSGPPSPPAKTAEEAAKHRQLDLELGIRPFMERPEVYRIAVPGAELRAGPSTLERGTSLLAAGDRVEVLSRYADRWVFVRLADGKTEGYLDATLLSPAD